MKQISRKGYKTIKILNLLVWDIKFQIQYGFYLLYAILTIIYCMVLSAFPPEHRSIAASVLIFSDPAAMGLFFMGAVVLLEKSQRVPWALAVSPVSSSEYTGGKVFSFCLIAVIVAAVLAVAAGGENLISVLAGTAIGSVMFTLAGVIIAAKASSLNQFLLLTIPIEAIVFTPPILHLFQLYNDIMFKIMKLLPVNVCMDLIAGRKASGVGLLITAGLIGVLFLYAQRCIAKMWQEMGGVRL